MSRLPKNVLITGADGSLGAAVLQRFASAGVRVVAMRRPGKAAHAVSQRELWIEAELADAGSLRQGYARAEEALGGIDAVIHCAGGFRYAKTEEISDADLSFLLDANLKSSIHLLREALPGMKKRGFGRMVFVSARATLQPTAGMGPYAATKAALNALVLAAADETRDFDININAVLPTMIDTVPNRRDMPGADFSKWVSVEALAEIIFSLTQEQGRPIHGALLPVSGRL